MSVLQSTFISTRKVRPIERREVVRKNWARRIRAAIGMGLTWGAAWFGAGLLLARVPGFYSDLPFALLFAPLGFVTGIILHVAQSAQRRGAARPLWLRVSFSALVGRRGFTT
jgi:hypothetical protein